MPKAIVQVMHIALIGPELGVNGTAVVHRPEHHFSWYSLSFVLDL